MTIISPNLKVEVADAKQFTNGAIAKFTNGETHHLNKLDDISADVQGTIRGAQGIRGSDPTDRVASEGRVSFELNNSEANSAGQIGYYSPGNANCKPGFEKNAAVRVSLYHSSYDSGNVHQVFWGYLRTVTPMPGKYRSRRTQVEIVDYIAILNDNVQAAETEILANATSDQAYTQLVSGMAVQPQGTSFDTGIDILPYVFHRSGQRSRSYYEEISRVAISVFDYVFVDKSGMLVSQNRYARAKDTTVQFTMGEDVVVDLNETDNRNASLNRVVCKIYPVKIGTANETAFELDEPIRLNPGDSYTLYAYYKDPNTQRFVGLAEGTGSFTYTFGTTGNGTDDNLHNGVSVTPQYKSAAVVATFTNTSNRLGFINSVVVEGFLIRFDNPFDVEYVRSATGNITLPYEMAYQSSATFAENANKMIADVYTKSRRLNWVKIRANTDTWFANFMDTEIGKRVAVTETVIGASGQEHFINGFDWELRPGKIFHVTYYLAPAITTTGAIWGVSNWGEANWKFAEG